MHGPAQRRREAQPQRPALADHPREVEPHRDDWRAPRCTRPRRSGSCRARPRGRCGGPRPSAAAGARGRSCRLWRASRLQGRTRGDARDGPRRSRARRCGAAELPDPEPGPGSCSCACAPAASAAPTCTSVDGELHDADAADRPGPPDRRRRRARRPGRRPRRARASASRGSAGPDGTCRFCRAGARTSAPRARFTGLDIHGGFAELHGRRRALLLPARRRATATSRSRRCCAPA